MIDHAPIGRAALAVTRHLAPHFPSHREDILQASWVTGLEMAANYRPSEGPPEPYFYGGMLKATSTLVHKWLSTTSISRAVARAGLAGRLQVCVPAENSGGMAPSPEDAAIKAEALREARDRAAAARVRWRREVERAARHLPSKIRAVGFMAAGLDGPRMTVPEIVRETGLWREEVLAAMTRFRRALAKTRAAELREAVEAAEAVLP